MSANGTAAAEEHGIRRSPQWHRTETHFLASNPRCEACSDAQHSARVVQHRLLPTRGLQVHHAVMPFHFCILLGRPDLELDPRNLATLCEDECGVQTADHHITVGHLLLFQSYMPDAKVAAATFRGLAKFEITSDPRFKLLVAKRPKPWGQLAQSEKDAMRTYLDAKLPKP